MLCQIRFDNPADKYILSYRGSDILKSKNLGYLQHMVDHQLNAKIVKNAITEYEVVSYKGSNTSPTKVAVDAMVKARKFTVAEKFAFMRDLVNMTISKESPSVIVCGDPGLGKTHTVLKCLSDAKLEDIRSIISSSELTLTEDDSESEIDEKVRKKANGPAGDYIIIKGKITPKALYRALYENRQSIIVFDDCDSVLLDSTAVELLKGALDSYDVRRIDWRTESIIESDLPKSFIFNGSIVFVSNLPITKFDPAVKSRSAKIDLSMSRTEKIEWMRSNLANVATHVDFELKEEALAFMEEKLPIIVDDNNINFRSLQQIIKYRASKTVADWKGVAEFFLTEGGAEVY